MRRRTAPACRWCVQFVLINRTEAEHFAEARCGGSRRQRTCGREFGRGVDDPADEESEDKVATAIAVGAENTVEADIAHGAESGHDMAVWQAADHGEGFTLGGNDRAAFQHAAQAFDVGGGPVGKIAQGALTNLAAFAVALTQQDGGRRVPIRNSFDVHGEASAYLAARYKSQI